MKLKETCTEVMAALKAMKEKNNFAQMDNPSFKKINAFIAKEIDVVTVIQNAFQRLVFSSRINWAEDPKLKEIVLKLGQNPACF
ncbi:hypothetical protein GDO78_007783 [Eleutherodactylus coqui]|nr:hypothetical protein GDO78_007783 [Eleutherodactylus coqui]